MNLLSVIQAVKSELDQYQSEVDDLHPPAVALYHHCLRVQKDPPDTQISANYIPLTNVLLTNFRPSVKKDQANYGTEEEEIQVIAGGTVAVGNLGENEPQKKAICPVPGDS